MTCPLSTLCLKSPSGRQTPCHLQMYQQPASLTNSQFQLTLCISISCSAGTLRLGMPTGIPSRYILTRLGTLLWTDTVLSVVSSPLHFQQVPYFFCHSTLKVSSSHQPWSHRRWHFVFKTDCRKINLPKTPLPSPPPPPAQKISERIMGSRPLFW